VWGNPRPGSAGRGAGKAGGAGAGLSISIRANIGGRTRTRPPWSVAQRLGNPAWPGFPPPSQARMIEVQLRGKRNAMAVDGQVIHVARDLEARRQVTSAAGAAHRWVLLREMVRGAPDPERTMITADPFERHRALPVAEGQPSPRYICARRRMEGRHGQIPKPLRHRPLVETRSGSCQHVLDRGDRRAAPAPPRGFLHHACAARPRGHTPTVALKKAPHRA